MNQLTDNQVRSLLWQAYQAGRAAMLADLIDEQRHGGHTPLTPLQAEQIRRQLVAQRRTYLDRMVAEATAAHLATHVDHPGGPVRPW